MQSTPKSLSIPQALQIGLGHHQAGRLSDAEHIYRHVLQVEANNLDALHLLGILSAQGGNNEAAVQLIAKALSIKPDYPEALSSYGNALRELKRYDEALASYNKALAIEPRLAEVLNNQGNILQELKRYDDALASYAKALLIKPDYAQALSNRGNALRKLHRYDEALDSYDEALSLKPFFAEALSNRGDTLQKLFRHNEALASYEKALAIAPQDAEVLFKQGNVLQELKQFGSALASYDKALSIRPASAEMFRNRGNVLHELKRDKEAVASYDRALSIDPDYAEAYSNRGNSLQELNCMDEALASYDRALAIKADYAEALSNRGNALQKLKRYAEAISSYDKACSIEHDYAQAHLNESLCRLKMGDYAQGWKKYEWRHKLDSGQYVKRHFAKPIWLGHDELAGKTILLHAEQGLGDTFQFFRYVRMVADRGARVILEVPPALRTLISECAGGLTVFSPGDVLPDFDFHCPLMSLPLAFNTKVETIPSENPYLKADLVSVEKWQKRLGPHDRPRVGIVWSGSPAHRKDIHRSIRLSELAPMATIGLRLVSLKNEVHDTEDERTLEACSQILHFGSEIDDFVDTAALVSLMDLVISVDTSVAHLAGAMGKSVWILLPYDCDWRWLVDREDSPWYPSARLFRQSRAGNWSDVVAAVEQQLCKTFGLEPVRKRGSAPAWRQLLSWSWRKMTKK